MAENKLTHLSLILSVLFQYWPNSYLLEMELNTNRKKFVAFSLLPDVTKSCLSPSDYLIPLLFLKINSFPSQEKSR